MEPDHLRSRLVDYFSRHSPGRATPSLGPLLPLTGGRASRLYTFTLGREGPGDRPPATLVLKLYAPDTRGRDHATREWRALTRLRLMDVPVPDVALWEPDARHLGHPFIVMDHIAGAPFWHVFEAADPIGQARLTTSFVAQLVGLHAVEPQYLEPAAAVTHPDRYLERELERLRLDCANSPHVVPAEVVRWLERGRQVVRCERPAILHRDYHPWNVLVDAAGGLWVIDWDWRIGDARFDLAWTCTLMERSGFSAFSSAVRDEYAAQSGLPLDGLAYFEVLTTVRWLLNVLPPAGSHVLVDEAAQADFRAFLVEPVQRAKTLVRERTGIDPDTRV